MRSFHFSESPEILAQLSLAGFALVSGLFPEAERSQIKAAIQQKLEESEQPYALRNLLPAVSQLNSLLEHPSLKDLLDAVYRGPIWFPVRSTFFDKPPGHAWKVPPHQDVTIEVSERKEIPGFGPWTRKQGSQCVQPPADVLQAGLAIRLHLDAATAANGALRLWPGSHLAGKLSDAEIQQWIRAKPEMLCEAEAGDVLLMRPLTVHASNAPTAEGHRRVVHLEVNSAALPNELKWASDV